MPESFTEEQITKIATYIQKKERLISALNSAIRTAEAPIYAQELNNLLVLLIDDKLLPDSFDTSKFFPELYPKPEKKKEKPGNAGKNSDENEE